MILKLFRRSPESDSVARLYGAIVAQARRPAFYQHCGVPDSVSGRFELIVLHLVLLLRRLKPEGEPLVGLGQRVFDAFCADMDANLREMGVGDLKVPKEMRRIGEAFYGRRAAYGAALDAGDATALEAALGRNIGVAGPDPAACSALAGYVRDLIAMFARQSTDDIAAGRLAFPDIESIATREPA
jgi:cytochrome b pre-mRNA-processing protein 3